MGQQRGEQVAGTGVHGHALPEEHLSEAAEGTRCRGKPSSAPRGGLASTPPQAPSRGWAGPRIEWEGLGIEWEGLGVKEVPEIWVQG